MPDGAQLAERVLREREEVPLAGLVCIELEYRHGRAVIPLGAFIERPDRAAVVRGNPRIRRERECETRLLDEGRDGS